MHVSLTFLFVTPYVSYQLSEIVYVMFTFSVQLEMYQMNERECFESLSNAIREYHKESSWFGGGILWWHKEKEEGKEVKGEQEIKDGKENKGSTDSVVWKWLKWQQKEKEEDKVGKEKYNKKQKKSTDTDSVTWKWLKWQR